MLKLVLASALLVGCSESASQPQCGAGQHVIDLFGESVCADDVEEVGQDPYSSVHRTTWIESNCATNASNHCANQHPYHKQLACIAYDGSSAHCYQSGLPEFDAGTNVCGWRCI
jgi:hypothetical protein